MESEAIVDVKSFHFHGDLKNDVSSGRTRGPRGIQKYINKFNPLSSKPV